MERRHITLPLTKELARSLHAGDQVYLTGTIYTSRDAGHKRMCEALARGEQLPFLTRRMPRSTMWDRHRRSRAPSSDRQARRRADVWMPMHRR